MSEASPADQNEVPQGFEIVADLLRRQESVLDDLNELDQRIEATIKSITKARQDQVAAEATEVLQLEQASDSPQSGVKLDGETVVEIAKAA